MDVSAPGCALRGLVPSLVLPLLFAHQDGFGANIVEDNHQGVHTHPQVDSHPKQDQMHPTTREHQVTTACCSVLKIRPFLLRQIIAEGFR